MLFLALSVLIGGGLGAALGYVGKCSSGTCPLAANPWRGAFFGALLGLLLYFSSAHRGGSGAEATPHVPQITQTQFESVVGNSATPVVVDFYANWCGPCKILSPRLNELAGPLANKVKFVKVDIDQSPQLAARFQVQAVPTLLFFRNGAVVDRVLGVLPPADLKSRLESLAAEPGPPAANPKT